jgi:hypothetical protein
MKASAAHAIRNGAPSKRSDKATKSGENELKKRSELVKPRLGKRLDFKRFSTGIAALSPQLVIAGHVA